MMMRRAFQVCFAEPAVTAIVIDPLTSNTRAHKFYRRLGFVPEGRRLFDDDDCLVHRLTREAWRQRFPNDLARKRQLLAWGNSTRLTSPSVVSGSYARRRMRER